MNILPSDIREPEDDGSQSSIFHNKPETSSSPSTYYTSASLINLSLPCSEPASLPRKSTSRSHVQNASPLGATLLERASSPSLSRSPLGRLRSSSTKDSRNSVFSTTADSERPLQSAKGVTTDTSYLTPEMDAMADAALSTYEEIRLENLPEESWSSDVLPQTLLTYDVIRQRHLSRYKDDEPPKLHDMHRTLSAPANDAVDLQYLPEESQESHPAQEHPFRNFTLQELERYFSAAIDVKHALHLRRSMVAVDIGDTLEALLPKIHLYEKDRAIIETVNDELKLIKDESSRRDLGLNFYALESMRSISPSHTLSVLEKHRMLFNFLEQILDEKDGAYMAAVRFLEDPFSLKEHRLPYFESSQR